MAPRHILIAAFAATTAVPASAQFSTNRDAPTVIDADVADSQPGVILLSGQVDVRQAEVRVLADTMKIYTEGGSNNVNDGIRRIEAAGNFYYITPEQEVKGAQGVYEGATETVTVTGDVVLLQGENVVTGDKLIYDTRTQEAKVVGTCQGRKCGSRGRVRILIKQQNDTPAAPAP